MAQAAQAASSLAGQGASFTLLAPYGLALLALLAPLVVLYILKVKRQRRAVGSTFLWAAAKRDLMAKAPFRRLLPEVPLLVQALAIALLAFALARPSTRGRAFTGDHVAIILDTSASMSAEAKGSGPEPETRFTLARRAARDLLSALAPGSDAIILAAGREARVVAPLDRDTTRAKAAVDHIEAEDVEGDLGAAVALAVDRLRSLGGSRRVVVITDGDLAQPAALAGTALPVYVITVGAPIDNAAIVRVDVRSGDDPALHKEQVQAFLLVGNFGKQPRDLFVTMREQNASDVLASRRVLVQPGERVPVVLTFYPSPGDYRRGLLFDLSPRDAMPVDDVAYGRVPAGDKLPVLIAGTAPWIERAIAADPRVELRAGAAMGLATGAKVDRDALVIAAGFCPQDPPGGDLLIVDPPQGRCGNLVVGEALDRPEITSWERGDGRLRFLTLDGVHVAKARALRPDGGAQELIRTREGPIAADISTATRSGTLLGFDVGDSDWPLKASFVLFMRNLLEQARAHRAHGLAGPARAGEPLRVSVPGTAKALEVLGPSGERVEASLRGGLAVVPSVAHAGLYQILWQGPQAGSTLLPVNLVSIAESDLSRRPLDNPGARAGSNVTVASAAAGPETHLEWSWIAALCALGLVVFDVWYLTRAPKAPGARGAS